MFASRSALPSPMQKTVTKSPVSCIACKEKNPLWHCRVFREKTPTQRTKLVAEHKLCFSCLSGQHLFRKCPQPRKCTKDGCTSTHNTLLHGADRIFPPKNVTNNSRTKAETSANSVTVAETETQTEASSGMASVSNVKGLLQITEVELQSNNNTAKVLVLCDPACSHSWISEKVANKLNVRGPRIRLSVHGINSHQSVETQMVEVKLRPVHSDGTCESFVIRPYVRKELNVGDDYIDVNELKRQYPHLDPIPLTEYRYGEVEMILGQDVFHAIRPLEYFDTDRKDTPIAVRLPLGWVLSGPLPSTSGLFSTCFKAVSRSEEDAKLADQL